MYKFDETVQWLLSGDVSIQYQTKRDLLNSTEDELTDLQLFISEEGWGKEFLDRRDKETGLWGNGIYSPKWISTHYTLLDLKNLAISPQNVDYIHSSKILLDRMWNSKVHLIEDRDDDICVCAMLLIICCYAKIDSQKIFEIIDFLLAKQFPDGGWNCLWRRGTTHSSVDTTLSVLEGFHEYIKNNYTYRVSEIIERIKYGQEYFLKRNLFKSLSKGKIISEKMLLLSYPCRWHYDILRSLDYFRAAGHHYDARMDEAIDIIVNKKRKNDRWPVQNKHPGKVHFTMEKAGQDSRWNTLRILRVIKMYRPEYLK